MEFDVNVLHSGVMLPVVFDCINARLIITVNNNRGKRKL